jgi:hypothetical protein
MRAEFPCRQISLHFRCDALADVISALNARASIYNSRAFCTLGTLLKEIDGFVFPRFRKLII